MQYLDVLLNANLTLRKQVLACNIICTIVNKNSGRCWNIVVMIRMKQWLTSIINNESLNSQIFIQKRKTIILRTFPF